MFNLVRSSVLLLVLLGISTLKERVRTMRKLIAVILVVAFLVLGAIPVAALAHGGGQDPSLAAADDYDNRPDGGGTETD